MNRNRNQPLLLLALLVTALFGLSLAALVAAPAGAQTQILTGRPPGQPAGLTQTTFLPLTQLPPLPPPLPEFVVYVTLDGGINASTFTPHSFQLINAAANPQPVTQVTFDLRTALFPDMVFDPFGQAGDLVAKDVSVDLDTGVGYTGRTYQSAHDDGFDVLILDFAAFDPGDQFNFSVDVDPTSIRGVAAPGPGESGSVSGLELAGATITVTFLDGLTLSGQLWPLANSLSGAQLILRQDLPAAPTVEVLGIPQTPATVTTAEQVIRVSGPAGQRVRLFLVQGALFTAGLPGGGFDVDPYEANSALQPGLQWIEVYMAGSTIDIPVVLSRTQPEGGLNHIIVAFANSYGMTGQVTAPIVLELLPAE